MTTWETIRDQLRASGIENYDQEAHWMFLLAARQTGSDAAQDRLLQDWLRRRCAGEPFQYVVGSVEFYSIELAVGPGVQIPRPETELLVEKALELLQSTPAGNAVLDLCTGSGAIPLALAHERPDLEYTGIDLSTEALRWAEKNRAALKPPRCRFLLGDLFAPLGMPAPKFQLLTANPPYVSPNEYRVLPPEVKDFEPRLALEAQEDGLALEKRIAKEARDFLLPGGWLLLEIGEKQGPAMEEYLQFLEYQQVEIIKDLAGRNRIAHARKSRKDTRRAMHTEPSQPLT